MEKSHVAGWGSESPTPAQLKEFFAQIAQGRITKQKLQNLLGNAEFKNVDLARAILGENIIFPDEIAEARGLSYSEDQLKQLTNTLPSEGMLRWLKSNNYALMPAPPEPLSLLEIKNLDGIFYPNDDRWWSYDLGLPKTTFEWLAIRKDVVPESTNKKWNRQCRLLGSEEYIPSVAELGWFITTYYTVRRIKLFEDICACTSSGYSTNTHVYLTFGFLGLGINNRLNAKCDKSLGIASARKLS